jgi:hypothetical protein
MSSGLPWKPELPLVRLGWARLSGRHREESFIIGWNEGEPSVGEQYMLLDIL